MVLRRQDDQWYGDAQADIRPELIRYSSKFGYPIHHLADVVCACGNRELWVAIDENQGVALRFCPLCEIEHPMGDSADYRDEADPVSAECTCGETTFEITVGVSLYDDSEDVRWLYLGCRCVNCGLLGCYADWKNEYNGYQTLFENL